jgi:hypothetical protein
MDMVVRDHFVELIIPGEPSCRLPHACALALIEHGRSLTTAIRRKLIARQKEIDLAMAARG